MSRRLNLEGISASRKSLDPKRYLSIRLSNRDRERLELQAMRLRAHDRHAYAATLAAELVRRGLDALEEEG